MVRLCYSLFYGSFLLIVSLQLLCWLNQANHANTIVFIVGVRSFKKGHGNPTFCMHNCVYTHANDEAYKFSQKIHKMCAVWNKKEVWVILRSVIIKNWGYGILLGRLTWSFENWIVWKQYLNTKKRELSRSCVTPLFARISWKITIKCYYKKLRFLTVLKWIRIVFWIELRYDPVVFTLFPI